MTTLDNRWMAAKGITNRQAAYLATLQRAAGEAYSGAGMTMEQAHVEINRLLTVRPYLLSWGRPAPYWKRLTRPERAELIAKQGLAPSSHSEPEPTRLPSPTP